MRVPAPSHMAVQDQLALVAKKEGFSISGDLGARVAVASARNLRRALLMLEVAYVQHGAPLPEDTKISPPDWEMYITVRDVLLENSMAHHRHPPPSRHILLPFCSDKSVRSAFSCP